jgi:hypothetical protein
MLDHYYEARGWDKEGIPTGEILERLGLPMIWGLIRPLPAGIMQQMGWPPELGNPSQRVERDRQTQRDANQLRAAGPTRVPPCTRFYTESWGVLRAVVARKVLSHPPVVACQQ